MDASNLVYDKPLVEIVAAYKDKIGRVRRHVEHQCNRCDLAIVRKLRVGSDVGSVARPTVTIEIIHRGGPHEIVDMSLRVLEHKEPIRNRRGLSASIRHLQE